jgi:hypothetical protein
MSAMVYSSPGQVRALGQALIEHIELALDLHRITIDRVFDLARRVRIEVAEAAAEERCCAHLPEQPRQALGARGAASGEKGAAELLGQVQQDRTGFEDAHRRRPAAVEQRRNLRVRVDGDEATGELGAVVDADEPGVVLRTAMAEREQLLQQHRDLHAVRRSPANRAAADVGRPAESWSCVAPAVGRLMAAKRPPFPCVHGPDRRRRVGSVWVHRM